MSNLIKSAKILRQIYSLLSEVTKLEMVKYSKSIQDKLNISLINYRIYSRKYIIGKKSGLCKVFDYKDNLIFEGEYLNGKKNGKGKEYNQYGELIFEGEYLNGKKWNGKGYYIDIKKNCKDKNYRMENELGYKFNEDDSNIYYEIKDGAGLMIDYDDEEYVYEGEYLNGERNGYGRDYKLFNNYLFIYEGEYLNGKRNGKGKEYINNDIQSAIGGSARLIFEGEYIKGKRWNGKGYDGNKKIVYEIKNGKGYIKEYYFYNLIFEGQYINGEKNGKGIQFIFNNNNCPSLCPNKKFEGEYLDGKKHGLGKEYNNEGVLIFYGYYLYNYKIKGTEYYQDGKIKYSGKYLFNQKWNGKGYDKLGNIIYKINNGTGNIIEYQENDRLQMQSIFMNGKCYAEIYHNNGGLLYQGGFKNGEKNGWGREYEMNINADFDFVFEGEFLNGKRWNGRGIESFKDLKYFGEYSNGRLTGKGQLYHKDELIFEGEFLSGKRWKGKGEEILYFGSKFYDLKKSIIFNGEYSNGEKNGISKEYYLFNKKLKFEGEYINGMKWNGIIYDIIEPTFYEIKNGCGFIKEYNYDGKLLFEGSYLNGRKWNGNIYFKNNNAYPLKNGKGFVKEYKYISTEEEIVFEGEYVNGQRNGKGKEYYVYQDLIYLEFEGEYLNGKKHGIGKIYCDKNLIYEGEYAIGKIKIIKNGQIQEKKPLLLINL